MKIQRRSALAAIASSMAGIGGLFPLGAAANSYPNKSIRLVVPWVAGGSTDSIARLMGDYLSKKIGQSIIIDNKPGATGTIGTAGVARLEDDGYTLLLGTNSTFAIAPSLYAGLPYDHVKDFAPIVLIGANQQILCVNPSLRVRDVQGFVEYTKKNPNKVAFSTSGHGGTSHLAMELLMQITQTQMLHVPYKGGAPALQSVIANEANASFVDITTAIPFVKAGKIIALGTSGVTRSPIFPDLPTLAEAGIANFSSETSFALFAPKSISSDKVKILNELVNQWLKDRAAADKIKEAALEARGGDPNNLTEYQVAEINRWGKLIKERDIRI